MESLSKKVYNVLTVTSQTPASTVIQAGNSRAFLYVPLAMFQYFWALSWRTWFQVLSQASSFWQEI